jgi:hypothetical protein
MPSSELLGDLEDKRQTPTGYPYTCMPLNENKKLLLVMSITAGENFCYAVVGLFGYFLRFIWKSS